MDLLCFLVITMKVMESYQMSIKAESVEEEERDNEEMPIKFRQKSSEKPGDSTMDSPSSSSFYVSELSTSVASLRQHYTREELRANAPESFCSVVNSTEVFPIDLFQQPRGYLVSHDKFFETFDIGNLTFDGIPIICKWRLTPPPAEVNESETSISETDKLVSFSFEGLDLPREPFQGAKVKFGSPGFECAWTFLRLYRIASDNTRQVLAEFCGSGWVADFDIPLTPGSSILVHAKLLQPFRGFKIYYEAMSKEEANAQLGRGSGISGVFSPPDVAAGIKPRSSSSRNGSNVEIDNEGSTTTVEPIDIAKHEACSQDEGLLLTSNTGKINFKQPRNSSVWCRWSVKPRVPYGNKLKYIKYRIPHFEMDHSPMPCQLNTFDVTFVGNDNETKLSSYCELKLPQPKKWQKADVMEGMEFVFRSKTFEHTAGFDLEYYAVMASEAFHADYQLCGSSLFRPQIPPMPIDSQMHLPVSRSASATAAPTHYDLVSMATAEQTETSIVPNLTTPIPPPLALLKRRKRVVGGMVARPGSWPWIAMLSFFGYPLCAATILSDRWLLTAAHCFKNERRNVIGWEVIIGKHTSDIHTNVAWDFKSLALRPTIELIMTHYRYGKTNNPKEYDIALVKVEQKMPTQGLAGAICPPSVELTGKELCYVIGFGETNDTSK